MAAQSKPRQMKVITRSFKNNTKDTDTYNVNFTVTGFTGTGMNPRFTLYGFAQDAYSVADVIDLDPKLIASIDGGLTWTFIPAEINHKLAGAKHRDLSFNVSAKLAMKVFGDIPQGIVIMTVIFPIENTETPNVYFNPELNDYMVVYFDGSKFLTAADSQTVDFLEDPAAGYPKILNLYTSESGDESYILVEGKWPDESFIEIFARETQQYSMASYNPISYSRRLKTEVIKTPYPSITLMKVTGEDKPTFEEMVEMSLIAKVKSEVVKDDFVYGCCLSPFNYWSHGKSVVTSSAIVKSKRNEKGEESFVCIRARFDSNPDTLGSKKTLCSIPGDFVVDQGDGNWLLTSVKIKNYFNAQIDLELCKELPGEAWLDVKYIFPAKQADLMPSVRQQSFRIESDNWTPDLNFVWRKEWQDTIDPQEVKSARVREVFYLESGERLADGTESFVGVSHIPDLKDIRNVTVNEDEIWPDPPF
ncbi:MAG: hypothetical protein JAY72_07920 [Candidatus Thiodiazotropha endolucinida]|nr:hypothetical protein [Candidatus Thiodiazotropha taylori]MCW4321593.1 hypothetical protein [Candidatus Thiodiazotropha taylori]